jgi:hypothetical protein
MIVTPSASTGTAQREVRVLARHRPAGHDQEGVDIGSAGDDRLHPADDHPIRAPLHDAHIGVLVDLGVRPERAVALAVGHRHADREVRRLCLVHIVQEARVVVGAVLGVGAMRGLEDAVERVVCQVALRAPGLLADDPHRLQLVQQVARVAVDVQQPVDRRAGAGLGRGHQPGQLRAAREVVGDADRRDAGRQARLVGHALHVLPVEEHARAQGAKGVAVLGGRHEHEALQPCVPGRALARS